MAKLAFEPRKEQDKSTWAKTFGIKIPGYSAKYNILLPDENRVKAGGPYAEFLLETIDVVDEIKKSWVDYKNIMFYGAPEGVDPTTVTPPTAIVMPTPPATVPLPGIFPHAVSIGLGIKKNINYIENDGQDMGLEGALKDQPDLINGKPTIKAVLKGVAVWILWKKGLFDGVWIEVSRNDGNEWTKLGEDYEPDFADTMAFPPQTVTWHYRAWYVMSDANGNATRVGLVSDVVSINVKG